MTKNEVALIVGFLNDLDNNYSNDGCNDMYLPDTPENRALYVAAEKRWAAENGADEEDMVPVEDAVQVPYGSRDKNTKKIGTNNQTILGYLRDKLMKEHSLTEKDIPEVGNW